MEKVRCGDRLRSDEGLAHAQVSITGQDNIPLLIIHRKRILGVCMGKMIERRIDS